MPKSRKKVKSKARKEAAKAKKAAAANEQERALDLQFQQLQLNNNSAPGGEERSNDMADEKCFHGYDGMSSEVEEIADHFVSTWIAAGSESIHQIYIITTDEMIDKYAAVWYDSVKMKGIVSLFLYVATQMLLDGDQVHASRFAMHSKFLQQWIAVELDKSQATFDWKKIIELYLSMSDPHTLVSFLKKNIPCSCLDDKYKEVKHLPKMGCCANPGCPLPGNMVERSATKKCAKCMEVCYCSRKCQAEDWAKHKDMCEQEVHHKIRFKMKVEDGLPTGACVCSLCNEDNTDKMDDVTEFFNDLHMERGSSKLSKFVGDPSELKEVSLTEGELNQLAYPYPMLVYMGQYALKSPKTFYAPDGKAFTVRELAIAIAKAEEENEDKLGLPMMLGGGWYFEGLNRVDKKPHTFSVNWGTSMTSCRGGIGRHGCGFNPLNTRSAWNSVQADVTAMKAKMKDQDDVDA